jgi:hypothetical protein
MTLMQVLHDGRREAAGAQVVRGRKHGSLRAICSVSSVFSAVQA